LLCPEAFLIMPLMGWAGHHSLPSSDRWTWALFWFGGNGFRLFFSVKVPREIDCPPRRTPFFCKTFFPAFYTPPASLVFPPLCVLTVLSFPKNPPWNPFLFPLSYFSAFCSPVGPLDCFLWWAEVVNIQLYFFFPPP